MFQDFAPSQRILIIDDQPGFRERMKRHLSRSYQVETAAGWNEGRNKLIDLMPNIILLDYKLEDGYDGLDVIKEVREERYDHVIIILVSAYLDRSVVEAARELGADAVISKNKPESEFEKEISRAVEDNISVRISELNSRKKGLSIVEPVFESNTMKDIREKIRRFMNNEENILITGEHGCGKEVLAAFIHLRSFRAANPFSVIGLPRLTAELFNDEFFGHVRGAYTDAREDKPGLLELAHLGTLVLDEIGELDIDLQPKLLSIMEHKPFSRVGGKRSITTNVRFIALTNRNLEEEVEKGRFKDDLYYRLKTFHIDVPPLRDRREDIPPLAEQILKRENHKRRIGVDSIDSALLDLMLEYSWPGNVRELEEWIKNGVTYAGSNVLKIEDVPQASRAEGSAAAAGAAGDIMANTYHRFKYESERRYLINLLESTSGKMSEAARRAGVMRPALYRLCKKHDIDPADFRKKNE